MARDPVGLAILAALARAPVGQVEPVSDRELLPLQSRESVVVTDVPYARAPALHTTHPAAGIIGG